MPPREELMVFFTGVTIAVLMYYWQQSALIYALCIALTVELLNLFTMNNLIKSQAEKLRKRYTEPLNKLKKQLRIAQTKEAEFRKSDQKQRDEIAALQEKIRELKIMLGVYKKKTAEQEEKLNRYENLPSRSKRSKPGGL